MSHYTKVQTQFKDAAALIAALHEMGWHRVEVHQEAQHLYGYQGDLRPETAHVIIRRQHTGIGASNDIGFLKQADGTYQAIVSDYDVSCLTQKFGTTEQGKPAYLPLLKQLYGVHKTLLTAQARMLPAQRVLVNGKPAVKITMPAGR